MWWKQCCEKESKELEQGWGEEEEGKRRQKERRQEIAQAIRRKKEEAESHKYGETVGTRCQTGSESFGEESKAQGSNHWKQVVNSLSAGSLGMYLMSESLRCRASVSLTRQSRGTVRLPCLLLSLRVWHVPAKKWGVGKPLICASTNKTKGGCVVILLRMWAKLCLILMLGMSDVWTRILSDWHCGENQGRRRENCHFSCFWVPSVGSSWSVRRLGW